MATSAYTRLFGSQGLEPTSEDLYAQDKAEAATLIGKIKSLQQAAKAPYVPSTSPFPSEQRLSKSNYAQRQYEANRRIADAISMLADVEGRTTEFEAGLAAQEVQQKLDKEQEEIEQMKTSRDILKSYEDTGGRATGGFVPTMKKDGTIGLKWAKPTKRKLTVEEESIKKGLQDDYKFYRDQIRAIQANDEEAMQKVLNMRIPEQTQENVMRGLREQHGDNEEAIQQGYVDYLKQQVMIPLKRGMLDTQRSMAQFNQSLGGGQAGFMQGARKGEGPIYVEPGYRTESGEIEGLRATNVPYSDIIAEAIAREQAGQPTAREAETPAAPQGRGGAAEEAFQILLDSPKRGTSDWRKAAEEFISRFGDDPAAADMIAALDMELRNIPSDGPVRTDIANWQRPSIQEGLRSGVRAIAAALEGMPTGETRVPGAEHLTIPRADRGDAGRSAFAAEEAPRGRAPQDVPRRRTPATQPITGRSIGEVLVDQYEQHRKKRMDDLVANRGSAIRAIKEGLGRITDYQEERLDNIAKQLDSELEGGLSIDMPTGDVVNALKKAIPELKDDTPTLEALAKYLKSLNPGAGFPQKRRTF